jgi:hypothetical protein
MEDLHKKFEIKLSEIISNRTAKLQSILNTYKYLDKFSQRIKTLSEQMCVFIGYNLDALKRLNNEVTDLAVYLKIIVEKSTISTDDFDTALLIYLPLAENKVAIINNMYNKHHGKSLEKLVELLIERFGLNFIPYVDFTHRTLLIDQDTECVICFDSFKQLEVVTTVFNTECKCVERFYHQKCFEESLDKGFHECMTCKVKFTKHNLMLVKIKQEEEGKNKKMKV